MNWIRRLAYGHPWPWAAFWGLATTGLTALVGGGWWALFAGVVVFVGIGLVRSRTDKRL
jgi:hypothetical protein